MLKFVAILLVVAAFAHASPTSLNIEEEDNFAKLLAKVGGQGTTEPPKFAQSTQYATICATELVNMETCNATTPVMPMEAQIAHNFERLIAELSQCAEMEEYTAGQTLDEQAYKKALLAVIATYKAQGRALPFTLAAVPRPTKLECAAGTVLRVESATLSNEDRNECAATKQATPATATEQTCDETTLAVQLVKAKCDDKPSCLLSVDTDFARVCQCATQKYLEVTYTCEAAAEQTTDDEDDDEEEEEDDEETTTDMAEQNKPNKRSKRQFGPIYDNYYYGPAYYDAYYYGPAYYDDYYGYGAYGAYGPFLGYGGYDYIY